MKILFMSDISFSSRKTPVTPEESKSIVTPIKPYLNDADFRIANLEEPLGNPDDYQPILKSGPNLISPAENICFYEALNTDIVTMANNHTSDFGEESLKDTITLIEKHNIKHIGAGKNIEEAYNAEVLEKDGVKVSLLGICENEFGIAGKDTYGSAGYNALRLLKKIREEKQKSDYVIVVFHGGDERNSVPSPDCIERYHLIIEFGADAVIAMHTHCPQGYEYYNEKPIIYSMGNFMFPTTNLTPNLSSPWFYGYMTMLDITKEKLEISEIIPYRFTSPDLKFIVFEGEEKEKMLSYIKKISDIIKDEKALYEHYIGWLAQKLPYRIVRDPFIEEDQYNLNSYKNFLTCEAHHSLIKEGYKLCMEHKMDYANSLTEKALERGKMPV